MKKKDIKKMLNDSFESATPSQSEELRRTPIVTSAPVTPSPSPARRAPVFGRYRAVAMACMCLVVVAAVVLAVVMNRGGTVPETPAGENFSSYITLSINPSFALTVDQNGVVETLVAENYDGEIVLETIAADGVDMKLSYDSTIKRLVEYAKTLGYLKTSAGISIDIYHRGNDEKIKSNMKDKINETLEKLASGAPSVTIGDMSRDQVMEYAREVLEDIADDIGDDDLFEILKGKHGYAERADQAPGEQDETIYDLFLSSYVMSVMDQMDELFEELSEYMEARGLTPAECEARSDLFYHYIKEHLDRYLAWMGDTRQLTPENYDALMAECEAGDDDVLEDAVETLLDSYRGKNQDAIEDAEEKLSEVLEDPHAAHWFACLKGKYPMTDASLLQQVMQLEREYRSLAFIIGIQDTDKKPADNSNDGAENLPNHLPNGTPDEEPDKNPDNGAGNYNDDNKPDKEAENFFENPQ